MSKKRTIFITGGPEATLACVAKHKKHKSMFSIYPVRYRADTRTEIDPRDYDKKDALFTFKFENPIAIDSIRIFLDEMSRAAHSRQAYAAGRSSAVSDFQKLHQYSDVDRLHHKVDRPVTRKKKESIGVKLGGLDIMSDAVFDALAISVNKESERRAANKEDSEKVKEEVQHVTQ